MMDAFICDAIRTPIGRFGGALSSIRADDLAALSIKELKERNTSIDWSMVDEVILDAPINQEKITETLLDVIVTCRTASNSSWDNN